MILTEEQRLTLKTNSPESKLYLSIYRPTTLLACRVNMASPAHGAVAITFDGVTSGAYTNVFKWATVLVGTEAGKDDIGTIWARSCTSTVLTVGMNTIHWADNYYLTVLNFVDIWNRPFSLELVDDEIVYSVDGDTAFASQDVQLGTFIQMGGNYAGFVGDQVYWDASGSENVAGNTVNYVWNFEGGDVSIHSGSTAGYVTYNTPGHYKTKLTATSSNAHVNISYRYVSVYDKIGDNTPYEFVGSDNFSGSREEGGWAVDTWIGEDAVPSIIKNTPAIVFAIHNFGGVDSDLFKIMFSGYVIEKNLRYSHISKTVECLLGSASEVMKLRPMTAVSVDSADTASAWTQVSVMTVKKFLYYYLNYYSTVLSCVDIDIKTGFDTYVKYYETSNGFIYDNINEILDAREGSAVFNREGIMYVERDPKGVDEFLTTVDETFGLEDSDYLEEVYIEESLEKEYGSLQIGGFSFSGTAADDTTPLLSQAPDDEYIFYSGDFSDKQGYAVSSQAELNQMAGSIYANDNAKYKNVEITLLPLYLNFDIAPLVSIPISVSATKNNAGISWTNKKFYCREMSVDLYNEQLSLVAKIILHEIIPVTYIYDGTTIEILPPMLEGYPNIEIPDFEDYSWPGLEPGGWNYNPPYFPIEPIVPEEEGATCLSDAPTNSYVSSYGGYVKLSADNTKSITLPYKAVLRSNSHDNKSGYQIRGQFLEWDSVNEVWVQVANDDFYTVRAYDCNGVLVANGVKDPVTSNVMRSGTFDNIVNTEICSVVITVAGGEVLNVTDVVADDDEEITWGPWGDFGVWVFGYGEGSKTNSASVTIGFSVVAAGHKTRTLVWQHAGNAWTDSTIGIDNVYSLVRDARTLEANVERYTKYYAWNTNGENGACVACSAGSFHIGGEVGIESGVGQTWNHRVNSWWWLRLKATKMIDFSSLVLFNVCPAGSA